MRARVLWCIAVAAAALAGCGGPAAPAPTPVPSPTAAQAASPDEVVCADYRDNESLLRQTAEALEQMPVLPAGVSLVLLGVRQVALTPGVQDPELVAAQAELVGAIDDLDAQGRAQLGPDGNPAQDAVQLDAGRILAALEDVERECGAPPF